MGNTCGDMAPVPRLVPDCVCIGFAGYVCSGKTTLLNMLFGLKLKTALGRCTMEYECVHRTAHAAYFDSPAISRSKHQQTRFISMLDVCVIVYDTDIADIIPIIVFATRYTCKILLVRTKVTENDSATDQLTEDIAHLAFIGYKFPIFFVGTRLGQYDLDRLRRVLAEITVPRLSEQSI